MNRGFKTEESIELSLSPSMHYELVGSNNPDASLVAGKLIVPRIGSADDCSVLLQVEGGKFTHSEIVNCLSKETKATIATKLEDVPVTAQQRVEIIMFLGFILLIALLAIKGVDYMAGITKTKNEETEPFSNEITSSETHGWNIGKIYKRDANPIYQAISSQKLKITTASARIKSNTVTIPISIINNSAETLTLSLNLISSVNQPPLSILKSGINMVIIFPGDSIQRDLQVTVSADPSKKKIMADLFIQSAEGETLSARRIINFSEP
ncbi:hypothetical protein [Chitinimonas sp. JJ19]|uniref:hypothetical protein n=1 Tax=Chitinimonas sp. JJ19 TaxID=3109352 RepID=UPI0030037231